MAVTMNNTVFWDVTPCNLVDVYRCLGLDPWFGAYVVLITSLA
jgi:hypothetical protein